MHINRLAWFWWVGSVASRFYGLESSPKGSFLERFPTLSKKKNNFKFLWWCAFCRLCSDGVCVGGAAPIMQLMVTNQIQYNSVYEY
jgi:hypothetical protein